MSRQKKVVATKKLQSKTTQVKPNSKEKAISKAKQEAQTAVKQFGKSLKTKTKKAIKAYDQKMCKGKPKPLGFDLAYKEVWTIEAYLKMRKVSPKRVNTETFKEIARQIHYSKYQSTTTIMINGKEMLIFERDTLNNAFSGL